MSPIANGLIVLVAPFLFVGIVGRVKGAWAGRRGPRLFQPFYDFSRLMKKGEVLSTTTSFVFRLAPSIQLAATLAAAALVPLAGGRALLSFEGDVVLFAYLLAAGRFMAVLSALDTGSSFAGMGASREAFFSALAEPAFFIAVGSLALFSGTTSFAALYAGIGQGGIAAAGGGGVSWIATALCAAAFFVMLLTEGSRLPVDDPATHLELTMVHEAMILDNSGPDLAFIQYGTALKMLLFACLSAGLLVPAGLEPLPREAFFFGILFALALTVGAIESLTARLRLTHVPQFILLGTALALIAFSAFLLSGLGGTP